ncbi:hypothetical protein [Kingella potus]|uniref:hypothetical protein n=1 Tax=Kingella potus TaxID=265175 RepID=UPI001FD24EAE|nr:hypothetical protein [Kingella potus]UOP01430.1 hypothetical protein LVJ84_04270 [Kingella potus]
MLNEVVVPDGIEYVVEEGGIRVSNRLTFYFRGVSYSASCGIEGVDNINPCNKNFYNKKLIGYNVKIIEIFEDSRRNIVGLLVNGDFKEKDKSSMYHFIRDEDFFNNELRQEKFKVYVHKITFIIFLIGAFISLVCLFISAKYNLFFRNGD